MSSEEAFRQLHSELGFAFSHHIINHLDSPLLEPLYGEPALVFQTDDPDFNAWSLRHAVRSRKSDDAPERPVALYYVSVPHPPSVEGIDWTKAKVLARFIMKPVMTCPPADHELAAV